MRTKTNDRQTIALLPRIRILRGKDVAFGPGKADLLEQIRETGSLNQAARRLRMSYMKAWLLVRVMNACYKKPLVKASRGGSGGGGAELTSAGERVLSLYRTMERQSLRAMEPAWAGIASLLKSESS
ncbi:MAG: LysR family transcriptional regulator [Terrimicrobiaceae bacterium]|nr:LysR family transcriptional regulator [Terrimicrobiaceae bacterium]